MTKLYDFKVGDEVWDVAAPGKFGTIFNVYKVSKNSYNVVVIWKNTKTTSYINGVGLRQKTLSKSCQPYSIGVMMHTSNM